MIDGFNLTPVDWTSSALLGLVVILILFGKLVPLSTHKTEQEQTRYWRGIAETNASTIADQAETIKVYAESAEFSRKVMEAIQQNAQST